MSQRSALLRRYLRQLRELGGPDLLLDRWSAADAHARITKAAARRRQRPGSEPAHDPPPAAGLETPPGGNVGPAQPGAVDTEGSRRLQILAREAAGCVRCRLHEGRRTVVFGEGNPQAEVVVVGEAPGQEEDRTGRPFVGRAGKLLDLLLMTAGFLREQVYICNVLKCRPPNNRNPAADEIAACTSSFLHPQLESIAPRALIAVGRFAVQSLLGTDQSIGRLRGRIHSYRGTPAIVTYHPAYLLRSPQMSRPAWDDFQLLRKVLDGQG